MFKKTVFAVLLAVALWHCPAMPQHRIGFKDGMLKIAQFTDIHWDNTSPRCSKTTATIESVLRSEQPDLAVLSGDIVTAAPAMDGWKAVAAIFENANVPFVVLMGNHDAEVAAKKDIYDYLQTCPHYIGERGPKDVSGYGNSILTVYGSLNGNTKPEALIYFLDSNDYPKDAGLGVYDWIHTDQIQWYRQQSGQFTKDNGGCPLPALAYFHIPLPEYKEIIGAPQTYGIYNEGEVCSPDINSGMFASFLEMGDVMGMFVGHDHNSDYIGTLKGIALGYGRKTGFDSYGDLTKGARIVILYEGKRQFDTYIATPEGRETTYYYPSCFTSVQEESAEYLQPASKEGRKHGVSYTYYKGNCRKLADMALCEKVRTGVMDGISIADAASEDNFAYEYRTLIKIPATGLYNFYTCSDDGSALFIDDVLVVNNDGCHSQRKSYGLIGLQQGFHNLRLVYFNGTGGKSLEAGFYSRDMSETAVTGDMLYLPD